MTTPSEDLRYFAEKIIAGEFKKTVAVSILLEEGDFKMYHEGGAVEALGMVTAHSERLRKLIFEDEEGDE